MQIAEGHQAVMPYLIVRDAETFLEFLKTIFGSEEKVRVLRDGGGIMHAEVNIGGSTVMLADATEQWHTMSAGMFIYVEDTDETYRKALAAGGTSVMEPVHTNYADRAAGFRDPFGNTWWLATIK